MKTTTLFRNYVRDDERGSLTLLMLVLFIGILLLTGFALDTQKHETLRADLQSSVDRCALATASLRHEVPQDKIKALCNQLIATRSLSAIPATVKFQDSLAEDITLNSRTVRVQASYDMPTDFLRLMGQTSLSVAAISGAIEQKTNVEISMVLDISGTMRWNDDTNSPAEADRRISKLKPAAQQFIDTVTANGTNPNVTVNIIPYAGNVNPGRFMFEALGGVRYLTAADAAAEVDGMVAADFTPGVTYTSENGIRVGIGAKFEVVEDPDGSQTFSSCLEVRPDDFPLGPPGGYSDAQVETFWSDYAADNFGDTPSNPDPRVRLPNAGSYGQVPHFNKWGYSNTDDVLMDWGWCPQDAQEDGTGTMAIKYMSNDALALKDYLGQLMLHDGTSTYIGMKYGLALLNPEESGRINLHPDVAGAYPGRPAAWDDEDTIKVIVLMTDGMYNEQWRPSDPLDTTDDVVRPRTGGVNESGASGSAKITGLATSSDINSVYDDTCDAAKALGVTVYTIAFDAPGGPANQMRRCASSESHFYDIDLLEIGSAFNSIATSIQRLKLVM